jgi:hypothetical protein
MATIPTNRHTVPEKEIEANEPSAEIHNPPTQDEVDARAPKIAARLMKQHEKTWTELAKY